MINSFSDNLGYRIVIIEDNKDLNLAYKLILEQVSGFDVVGTFYSCEDAILEIKKLTPNLILMDLDLPGIDGIEGIKKIRKYNAEIKILVITVHEDDDRVFSAISAGAIGYITKKSNHSELISSVEKAAYGGTPLSDEIARKIVKSFQRNPDSPLTQRETEVLAQLAQGKTYNYISKELDISFDTVKTHIKHIYWKLKVDNKSEAVILARKKNYI